MELLLMLRLQDSEWLAKGITEEGSHHTQIKSLLTKKAWHVENQ